MSHGHRNRRSFWSYLVILALLCLVLIANGCSSKWEVQIERPDGTTHTVDASALRDLDKHADIVKGIPLERLLWNAGHYVIDTLTLEGPDSETVEVDWPGAAETSYWRLRGSLSLAGETLTPAQLDGVLIRAQPPALLADVEASILDIPATAAHALGMPAPSKASGRVLDESSTEHVMLLFLDGFGYVRYQEALADGLIPELAALGAPTLALSVYPPCTKLASGALLTGAHPEVSGVTTRSDRKTEIQTLFDVAAENDVEAFAVEGEALSFNLRNVKMQLSGDRDGNGSTDDNVLANTMAVLHDQMPELFFVHFHGIDDAGHSYGPGAEEEIEAIRFEDAAVGQILKTLPESTMLIIFADHGMHLVNEDGRLGNHGNLVARDMFIPIIVHVKE